MASLNDALKILISGLVMMQAKLMDLQTNTITVPTHLTSTAGEFGTSIIERLCKERQEFECEQVRSSEVQPACSIEK